MYFRGSLQFCDWFLVLPILMAMLLVSIDQASKPGWRSHDETADEAQKLMLRILVATWVLLTLPIGQLGCTSGDTQKGGTPEVPSRASGPVRFSEQLIMDNYAYPYGIWAADLDGDGDLDLTSADYRPHNKLYWFENDGSGNFERHFIQKDDPERLERHMVGDVNNDTRPDVVIVKNLYGHLLWFQNPGSEGIRDLWKRHVVTTRLAGAYNVDLSDLDADGDLDVAASSWRMGNQFAWFENPGILDLGPPTQLRYEEGREWAKHVIDDGVAETRCIRVADVDGDGDADLMGTGASAGLVLWYENSGDPKARGWIRHVIDTAFRPMHGNPVDMDRDGDPDLVLALGSERNTDSAEGHQVVWYENDGTPADGPWSRHLIFGPLPNAFEAVAGDLDGDGDVDVAATGAGDPGQVVWLENSGDPRTVWAQHVLKTSWPDAIMCILADLDGNGLLDIAAVSLGANEFRWWRNEGAP